MCKGREETAFVAEAIAPFLRAGDAMLLKGALASGKTAFVQELVAALGATADVTSPTFTLAHFYPMPVGTFLHIDAYRLSSVAEFRDLALEDYVPESITAVEWGDIVEEDFSERSSIAFRVCARRGQLTQADVFRGSREVATGVDGVDATRLEV